MRYIILFAISGLLVGCFDVTKQVEDALTDAFVVDPIVGLWQDDYLENQIPNYFIEKGGEGFVMWNIKAFPPEKYGTVRLQNEGAYVVTYTYGSSEEWSIAEEGEAILSSGGSRYERKPTSSTTIDSFSKELDAIFEGEAVLGLWGIEDETGAFEPYFFVEKGGFVLRLHPLGSFAQRFMSEYYSDYIPLFKEEGRFIGYYTDSYDAIELSASGNQLTGSAVRSFTLVRGETKAKTFQDYSDGSAPRVNF